jgi:hypothetical protein
VAAWSALPLGLFFHCPEAKKAREGSKNKLLFAGGTKEHRLFLSLNELDPASHISD